MVLNGAEIWGSIYADIKVVRQLRATERPVLRDITKTYTDLDGVFTKP